MWRLFHCYGNITREMMIKFYKIEDNAVNETLLYVFYFKNFNVCNII